MCFHDERDKITEQLVESTFAWIGRFRSGGLTKGSE
jgi:hypothetical protein